jgi:uncharacterized membrane protein
MLKPVFHLRGTPMAETGKKKVTVKASAKAEKAEETKGDANWQPTAEAKSGATIRRVFAIILWVLAIGGEAFGIFWLLKRPKENGAFPDWAFYTLLGLLVVIGLLTFFGSQLWKKANKLDPASKSNGFRFFVQNQLGVIITIIAFVPLIVLIFLNKDMNGKQKGIAGGVGIVLLLVTGFFSTELDSASKEQYSAEQAKVVQLTGGTEVTWTKSGEVYHLCDKASDVNLVSADNTIYSGDVAAAHEAGKQRLTLKVDQEIEQCDLTPGTPTDETTTAP